MTCSSVPPSKSSLRSKEEEEMVHDLFEEQEKYKERLSRFRGMNEVSGENNRGKHGYSRSMVLDATPTNDLDNAINSRCHLQALIDALQKDMDMMKERFGKLLLGEDMSGGRKGASSAFALSNAITNLAASVFGEHRKLEPLSAKNKARWRKEIDWLLSVTNHIVEFVPSIQTSADGTSMEIMRTKQRADLELNIPALRKLDAMLIDCLDNFKDKKEFYYVSKDAKDSENGPKRDDKWWLPTVKVAPNGLSEGTKEWLEYQKKSLSQVLKASMAINAEVISQMEIPETYIESLPKNGRASLGDSIYKSITADNFYPAEFLSGMELELDHQIVDIKNRIEASIVIWNRKMTNKDSKPSWGSGVSLEKRGIFEERAETILVIIKQEFPGIPQSSLEISKIEFNRDVGHAVLESYSRILECLAHKVKSQIEEVLYVDSVIKNPSLAQRKRNPLSGITKVTSMKFPNADEEIEKLNATGLSISMTLSHFMGWTTDNVGDVDSSTKATSYDEHRSNGEIMVPKITNIIVSNKSSYVENLGGVRSPTARH